MKAPCVYVLASKPLGTLYVGVTSDLHKRMAEHSQGLIAGFTKRYGVKRLVYFEMHESMTTAIRREKQIKDWMRLWKVRLIERANPEWHNLFDDQSGEIVNGPRDEEGFWEPCTGNYILDIPCGRQVVDVSTIQHSVGLNASVALFALSLPKRIVPIRHSSDMSDESLFGVRRQLAGKARCHLGDGDHD